MAKKGDLSSNPELSQVHIGPAEPLRVRLQRSPAWSESSASVDTDDDYPFDSNGERDPHCKPESPAHDFRSGSGCAKKTLIDMHLNFSTPVGWSTLFRCIKACCHVLKAKPL
jgi:hypothetical protein